MGEIFKIEINDERLAREIKEMADVQKIRPEQLIELIVAKSLAPWSNISKNIEKEMI